MEFHNQSSFHLLLFVTGTVLFAIAGFAWPVPVDSYRTKIIGLGLFFCALSTFF